MKEISIILLGISIIMLSIISINHTNQIKDLQYCLNTPLDVRDEERCR